MFEDIKKNKIKSGIIVSMFIIIITLIAYYICMAFDLGYMSIIIAFLISIISVFGVIYLYTMSFIRISNIIDK